MFQSPVSRRLRCITVLLAVLSGLPLPWAYAQTNPAASSRLPLPLPGRPATPASAPALLACLILPARTAELGSPVVGVVASVDVERGDFVKRGQILARLRADVEAANSGVARTRADSEAEWRGALASQDLARIKLERARHLKEQNFVSGQAVEQAESEFRIAKERASQVREQLDISSREASSAMAQLSQRTLRAPFDGVITERYANPGERFEDKPLLKMADIAQLRVDVVASTALFGSLKVGQEITVRPDLPGTAARLAHIAQIDRVLDPASNTFRMRLDMANPANDLPAGLRCKAELGKDAATAAAAGSPSATPPAMPSSVSPSAAAPAIAGAGSGAGNPAPARATQVSLPASATSAAPQAARRGDDRNTATLPAPASRPPSAPLPSMERLLLDLSPLTGGKAPAVAGGRTAPAASLSPERR